MRDLMDYQRIVGYEKVAEIYRKAHRLYDKHILHVNSTYQGGGVAEMLNSLIPLMNDVGVDTGWRILHGTSDFFNTTKTIHNAIQGEPLQLGDYEKQVYTETNRNFSVFTHINHDCVVIHDPQPLPLILYFKKRQPWIWRCHIDLSAPDGDLWDYLKQFVLRYDIVLVSSERYRRVDLPVTQKVLRPAIDPLSPKNVDLPQKTISQYIREFNIPTDRPLITQISRFDKWKSPEQVLDIFEKVRRKVQCRLVLCGSAASDDPECHAVYERTRQKAHELVKSGEVVLLSQENSILVNVLQRVSAVLIQKSTREGFGLTVTEGMWKGKPVIASNTGGIPLQITHGKSGFLVDPHDNDGFANTILDVLKNPMLGSKIGQQAKDIVRKKFLITRLLADYLDLLGGELS